MRILSASVRHIEALSAFVDNTPPIASSQSKNGPTLPEGGSFRVAATRWNGRRTRETNITLEGTVTTYLGADK
jgi:hypothetical protein